MSGNDQDKRVYAPATARNREPMLDVLRDHLPGEGLILEIASGSGEHAAWLAPRLGGVTWQPSDPEPASRESIAAWTANEGVNNINPPLDIDVTRPDWHELDFGDPVAAVVCINMIHIAPWQACLGLMSGAGKLLGPGGVLCLYGPFFVDGVQTAPSNIDFDLWLRDQDPAWGVRDLKKVTEVAESNGFFLTHIIAMPANNFSIIFRRGE